jgi:hypothetical protein
MNKLLFPLRALRYTWGVAGVAKLVDATDLNEA